MYKKITLVLGALCLGLFAEAQNENDAFLLSRTYQYGTARNLSLSGATGSLGADFGAVNNNPAGLGLFRNSEFSFTPNVFLTGAEGAYQGNNTTRSDSRFNFNQLGVVIAKAKKGKKYKESKWKTSNISIGFNRLANLHTDFNYQGTDNSSSFVETFAEEINDEGGYNNNALNVVSEAAYGAFETYLIDADQNDTTQAAAYVPFGTGLNRNKVISREGAINEINFSYGANYDEKLLLGFSVGLPIVDLTQTEILSESDNSGNPDNDFASVDLTQNILIEGNGVNLKLGAIFKPTNALRFGLAYHSPTRYNLTDISAIQITSNTENFLPREFGINNPVSTYNQQESNLFEYRLITPMKAIASGTALFGKKGFISADVEWINYESMKYRYDLGFEVEELAVNTAIQETFKNAVNIRVGGEVRLDQLALRAGYGFYGNPYEEFDNGATHSGSLGLGYRAKSFYFDLAGQYMVNQDLDRTHTLARAVDIPTAVITNRNTQISATVGFRF